MVERDSGPYKAGLCFLLCLAEWKGWLAEWALAGSREPPVLGFGGGVGPRGEQEAAVAAIAPWGPERVEDGPTCWAHTEHLPTRRWEPCSRGELRSLFPWSFDGQCLQGTDTCP